MGAETRRIPLPAPTDISSSALGTSDDLATEISRATDRTSYSIPEDGSPVTITTKKVRGSSKDQSQTSLLIEYFEGSKPGEEGVKSRPSVRVRVTPSASKRSKGKGKEKDHIQITETGRNRKPSYTRRISLPQSSDEALVPSEISDTSSGRPPVEVEVLQGTSDLSQDESRFYVPASDVSSMPPDSMLEESTPALLTPKLRTGGKEYSQDQTVTVNTLMAPTGDRDRSVSRERLAQSAMKKIQERQAASRADVPSGKLKASSRRSSGSSVREYVIDESETQSPRTRTRRSRESENLGGGYLEASEVSALSTSSAAKSALSARSNASSINNPKLLSAVEDAIKRLILPELTAVKEEQARQKNRYKFEEITRDSMAPAGSRENLRRVSKSSSTPNVSGKPAIIADDKGVIEVADSIKSRKSRRSSRDSGRSHETAIREETSRRSSREKKHGSSKVGAAALAGVAAGGLTAAALRHHDSIQSLNEEREMRERRKKRSKSKSRSRSASISERREEHTTEETRDTLGIPPMPILQQESDVGTNLTRDSIQSVESDRPSSVGDSYMETKHHEVKKISTGSPRQIATPEPRTPTRTPEKLLGGSPVSIRSDGSAGRVRKAVEDITMAQHDRIRSLKSGESLASGRKARKHRSNLSVDSGLSSPEHELVSRQRPQGINLEHPRDILPEDPYSPGSPAGDNWFEREHEKNEQLRREYEEESQVGSNGHHYGEDSYLDVDKSFDLKRDMRDGAAANAEYVHTPVAVESAVASLHEPSLLSSVHSSAKTDSMHEGFGHDGTKTRSFDDMQHASSKERWEAIRDQAIANARQQAGTVSPRQSEASLDGHPVMGASAMPVAHEQLPEVGYGYDDQSEVTTNPSIIKGPIGGLEHGNRDHWPYDPTPAVGPNRDSATTQDHTARDLALGAGAGAAAVGLGLAAARSHESTKSAADMSNRQQAYVDDVQDEQWQNDGHVPDVVPQQQHYGYASPSGGRGIDEGYMSGAVPGGEPTPDLHAAQNRTFDNASLDDADDEDPFTSQKRLRYASGLSHGMASPLYDATTGKGIDRIKDRDVVALMDHLTVRDAQRNARDTEILVTLVRTAAEMRNQWEDMKKFLQEQDKMVMAHTDRAADKTVQRVLGGPRPYPGPTPAARGPRRSTSDETDDSTKAKKNLFRRAFKSLGSKNQDLTKIEGMLMQLLDEVEDLKLVQNVGGGGSQHAAQDHTRSNSIASYDNLRTVQDPGYEPEGMAGTSSSPAQSGHLSNPSSKHIGAMHSGYDARRSSEGHRISTVLEGDEEDEDWTPQSAPAREAHYLSNDGMNTPTQEVRRHNSMPLDGSPVHQRAMQNSRSAEETPRTGERKSKHKSGASWLSGKIPQISRWSKTTASTMPDPPSAHKKMERPYSQMSQSGEQLPMEDYDDYNLNEDDRLRSRTSLDNENMRQPHRRGSAPPRSPSPLIPEDRRSIEDPKYQAHRNSLNLMHPQPRPGPTHRHQTNLENQAGDYGYEGPTNSELSELGHDQWGNTPALALNRLNRFSGSSGQTAQTATTQRRDDLSPVQSEDSHGDAWSEHSASEQAHNRLPTQQGPPRPPKIRTNEGPLVPPKVPFEDEQPSATLSGPGEIGFGYHSPYSNSGMHIASPLEPIEEVRYSLETDRSSVARRDRVCLLPTS